MDILRSKLIRLAHVRSDLRPYLLPLLKTANVPGWGEGEYLDEIWTMYEATYRTIGMSKASPSEMISSYDVWEVFKKGDQLIAFVVSKTTPRGIKLGLAGSNGSPEGKTALKTYLARVFDQSGRYAEVSHAIEHIVMKANPPVVCAVYADEVLRENIVPSEDAMHYTRSLSGVGNVEKILVGKPKGVPTTNPSHPACPVGDPSAFNLVAGGEAEDDPCDLDAHLSCQIDL